jgi:uncharacterized protein YrrD
MHRAKDLFGRPVVSADGGERLGEVADVLIDEHRQQVAGLVVRSGWFGGERVLPFSGVRSLGGDAVIAYSADGLIASREWRARADAPAPEAAVAERASVSRERTADGDHQPTVNDAGVPLPPRTDDR